MQRYMSPEPLGKQRSPKQIFQSLKIILPPRDGETQIRLNLEDIDEEVDTRRRYA